MANGLSEFQEKAMQLDSLITKQNAVPIKPKMLILAERQQDPIDPEAYGLGAGFRSYNRDYSNRNYANEVGDTAPSTIEDKVKIINSFYSRRDSSFKALTPGQRQPYVERDSTHFENQKQATRIFSQEANWFKGQNPDLDVEVRDFRGAEELASIFKGSAEKYKDQNLSLGIFGHAGSKFGGVEVSDYKTIADTTGFNASCTIDEVLMGSCNLGSSSYDKVRNDIAGAFNTRVTGQQNYFGTSKRTPEDIQAFKDTGVSDIGSRLFNPGSTVNSVEFDSNFEPNAAKRYRNIMQDNRTADSLAWESDIADANVRIAAGTLSEAFRPQNPFTYDPEGIDNGFPPGFLENDRLRNLELDELRNSNDPTRLNVARPTLEDLQAAPQRPEDFINIINQIAELP